MEKLKNAASPLDFFLLFFDDDILKLICSESNRCYAEKYIEGLNNNDQTLSEYLSKVYSVYSINYYAIYWLFIVYGFSTIA